MHTISRFSILVAGLATASACRPTMSMPQPTLTARLGARGVDARERAVMSGSLLQFVNDDVRQHEIYSNDCPELASTPLAPGQAFVTLLQPGPKVCHFQDLLAPGASEYWGTVRVTQPPAATGASAS